MRSAEEVFAWAKNKPDLETAKKLATAMRVYAAYKELRAEGNNRHPQALSRMQVLYLAEISSW